MWKAKNTWITVPLVQNNNNNIIIIIIRFLWAHLRANVCKNRAKSKFRGHSQKIIFAHILSIDRYKWVIKRGVVCFSKGCLDLEKIDKINFRGRRLENNQNLRQNEAVSKLRTHTGRMRGKIFPDKSIYKGFYFWFGDEFLS